MKINIEGGEFPLMEHIISCDKQAIVRQYQIQFHNFVENPVDRRIQISHALSETHMRTWCYTFVWENWRKIWKANTLQSNTINFRLSALSPQLCAKRDKSRPAIK